MIELYIEEQTRGGNWTEKTKYEIGKSLDLLVQVIGDLPVKAIKAETMREFKEILVRLPAHMATLPQYRGKSIQEVLAMKIDRTMSLANLNKRLTFISSLFNWAVTNGFMDKNPARGMQLGSKGKGKKASQERDTFTTDDLTKLFHSREYLEDDHKHPYRFWLPILGLFTGARLEELCQLHLEDIRQESGVWVFDINAKGENKKLKNDSSARLVPIHPFLIDDLKLPQYADSLRAKGYVRLFTELDRARDGYSPPASKWFGRYRKSCGVNEDTKVFHSFRHTFIDNLKQNPDLKDKSMISEVVGHDLGDNITLSRYGKNYRPELLFEEVVKRLRFGADLSHLKKSKFVVA